MEVILDSGLKTATCDTRVAQSVSCNIFVEAGDYDFDGQIEIPAGAVKFTGWQDGNESTVTGSVASPLPMAQEEHSIPYRIYGGTHAIDLRVTPKTLQEGVGEQTLTVTAQSVLGSLAADLVIPLTFTDISTSSSDYIVGGSPSVTIPAGMTEGSAAVRFTPVDDLVREALVEMVRIEGARGAMMTPFVRGAELRLLDAAGIRLSVAPTSVAEDGGAQQVTVTAELGDSMDSVLPRAISVALDWGGIATSADYTRSGGATVTIPANARSGTATVTITPTNDNLLEGDKIIGIRAACPGRAVTGTELTLTDDETAPFVVLGIDENAVSEGDNAATAITVSAELDPDVAVENEAITVTLNLGGTAMGGTDYTSSWSPSTAVITIPAGSRSGSNTVTLTLTPTDDQVAEGDETVVVQGTATAGTLNLVVRVATITLSDDDGRVVNILPAELTVAEGAEGTYEVWRGSQPTGDVTVSLSSSDATTATTDVATLTFTTANWNMRQEVTVTGVEDDRNNAGDQRIAMIQHTAGGGGYDDVDIVPLEVTVTDNDEASRFSIADAGAAEGDAITFTVTRAGAAGEEATVSWQTANDDTVGGNPASAADYSGQTTAQVLTFDAGATEETITVATTEDSLDEPDETFRVLLSAPSPGVLTDGTAIGTITDDDPVPAVSVGDAAAVTEGDDPMATTDMTFPVTLSAASGRIVTVPYTLTGTATAGTDHTATASGSVTINAGTTTTDIVVPVRGDTLDEENETVIVTLGTPTNATIATTAGAGTGTITDDDDPPVAGISVVQSGGATEIVEGGASDSYTIVLDTQPTQDVTVTVTAGSGARINRSGGTAGGTQTLTFSPGGSNLWSSAQTIAVTAPDNDADDAAGRTVSIAHSSSSTDPDYQGLTIAAVDVTVIDDDPTEVTLTTPDTTAEEGSSTDTATITLTLGRGLVQGESLVVPLQFAGGAPGAEFTLACPSPLPTGATCANLATSPQITFTGPASGAGAVSVTLTLSALEDADSMDETVSVSIPASSTGNAPILTAAGLGGGATGSSSGEAIVIADNDEPAVPPGVTVSRQRISVSEAGGRDSYTVVLDAEPAGSVSVGVSAAAGVLLDGPDPETAHTGTEDLHFLVSDWSTPQIVTIRGQDDDLVNSPDRVVTISHVIRSGDGAGYTPSLDIDDVEITLVDDDIPVSMVRVSEGPAITEGDEAVFTLTADPPPAAPMTVNIAVSENSADDQDFVDDEDEGRRRIGIPASGSVEFRVATVDDDLDEADGEVMLRVETGRGYAPEDADRLFRVTVSDDDEMQVTPGTDPMAAWQARFGRTVAEQALAGVAGRIAAPRTSRLQGGIAGHALAFEAAGTGIRPAPTIANPGHAGGLDDRGDAGAPDGSMSLRQALLQSDFTATGEIDSAGGNLAVWGRAASAEFRGSEGGLPLDGTVTTAALGADYLRGDWLVGMSALWSTGEGVHGIAGDEVEASLAAAVPYAAFRVSDRLTAWGALGHGTGTITFGPATEHARTTGLSWSMAAAGARGELLAGARAGGLTVAIFADSLWALTRSAPAPGLPASDTRTTRRRFGLVGGTRLALDDGSHLAPRLELAIRRDGGDAETGQGLEVGLGLGWHDPSRGLALDLSGWKLMLHSADRLQSSGYSAALVHDRDETSKRGLSVSLRQDAGGSGEGGLHALPAPEWENDAGRGTTLSRTAEAAYGLPVLDGRFTGSPHVTIEETGPMRELSLGWRLTPEAAAAPDLSFGLVATRRERGTGRPGHRLGLDVTASW